jgi:hypothetical protein
MKKEYSMAASMMAMTARATRGILTAKAHVYQKSSANDGLRGLFSGKEEKKGGHVLRTSAQKAVRYREKARIWKRRRHEYFDCSYSTPNMACDV